jgi:hypothetical protein
MTEALAPRARFENEVPGLSNGAAAIPREALVFASTNAV